MQFHPQHGMEESSVRSRSGPPNNRFKIRRMPQVEHSLLPMTWCHARRRLVSIPENRVRKANLSFGAVSLCYKSKDELILAAFSSALQEMKALFVAILAREEEYPLPVLVRKITKIITLHTQRDKLNFGVPFLMGWSQAQANPKVKKFIGGGQELYRQTP
jgi:hypothetical protein